MSKPTTASSKPSKKTVLITGCSDGGLGAALAIAMHRAGWDVIATARNLGRLNEVKAEGIKTMQLDVLSSESITKCVESVSRLDMLVNNAGALYSMPFSDMEIAKAKDLFDLNVWSFLEVSQAFLPLLLQSKGFIVHQVSTAALLTIPFQSAYNASKSAMSMFSNSMRLELAPFGVKVIELKTGSVTSRGFQNQTANLNPSLPKDSLYQIAREAVEKVLTGEFAPAEVTADQWAVDVARKLSSHNPPAHIWGGTKSGLTRFMTNWAPTSWVEGMMKKLTGMDVVERNVGK